jgi:hypothetical protein
MFARVERFFLPLVGGVSVLLHLGTAGLATELIPIDFLDLPDWFPEMLCWLAGHRLLQSGSLTGASHLFLSQHADHWHILAVQPIPTQRSPEHSTTRVKNTQLYVPHFRSTPIKHWWFSGKIGRCHLKLPSKQTNVGQPRVRFPADA